MRIIKSIAAVIYAVLTALSAFCGMNEAFGQKVRADDVIACSQYPEWPTGCESVALYILLDYYRVDASVRDIVEALPKELLPWEEDGITYGGNPERGFVGDPSDRGSYGVLNGPIAAAANRFLGGAVAESGLSVRDVESILRSGAPLICWVSMYPHSEPKISHWTDAVTGEQVTWIGGEHAVVVYGREGMDFKVSDPRSGRREVMSRSDFAAGFARHGGRVVYYPE